MPTERPGVDEALIDAIAGIIVPLPNLTEDLRDNLRAFVRRALDVKLLGDIDRLERHLAMSVPRGVGGNLAAVLAVFVADEQDHASWCDRGAVACRLCRATEALAAYQAAVSGKQARP